MSLLGFLRRGRKDEADVAVLGSGVPALAVALELARRSQRVSVLVRGGGAGPGAGLGLVALGTGLPYTRMVRVLGREEARAVWAAGRLNLERVRAWLARTREECGFEERGTFLLAADRDEAEALADSEDLLRDDGFPGEFLDHYMLETHFDVSGFPGAYWATDGAELDPTRFAPILAAAGRAAGARFHPSPVTSLEVGGSGVVVETEEGTVRAATAVVATDTAIGRLLPGLAPRLRPAAGKRMLVPLEDGATLPTTARTGDGRVTWQVSDGRVALAATGGTPGGEAAGELEGFVARLPVRVADATRWEAPAEAALDGLPLIGALPGQPLAVASGFGPAPASLAFAAAAWIADALTRGSDPTPVALRAGREPAGPGGGLSQGRLAVG